MLHGDTSINDITLNDWNWYKENHITLYTGEKIVGIETTKQIVYSDKKRVVSYNKLILATGSIPIILPIPGSDKNGVTAFRISRIAKR